MIYEKVNSLKLQIGSCVYHFYDRMWAWRVHNPSCSTIGYKVNYEKFHRLRKPGWVFCILTASTVLCKKGRAQSIITLHHFYVARFRSLGLSVYYYSFINSKQTKHTIKELWYMPQLNNVLLQFTKAFLFNTTPQYPNINRVETLSHSGGNFSSSIRKSQSIHIHDGTVKWSIPIPSVSLPQMRRSSYSMK